jgi:methionyl aminopeptidase
MKTVRDFSGRMRPEMKCTMARIKNEREIATLREAGRRLAAILAAVASRAVPGVSAAALNAYAEERIRAGGDTPAFLGYRPRGAPRPFPAALCVSVNDEVVHGIPNEREKILREGDIVGLDLGLAHAGLVVDAAVSLPVGAVDERAARLIAATREALARGIAAARAGSFTGDIGRAIEAFVRPFGYGIVEELGGHGVGHAVHEQPFIPNFSSAERGARLVPGMVLAIEPMLTEGGKAVTLDADGYTFRTKDGGRSAHFEHTVAVTKSGVPEILTGVISPAARGTNDAP